LNPFFFAGNYFFQEQDGVFVILLLLVYVEQELKRSVAEVFGLEMAPLEGA